MIQRLTLVACLMLGAGAGAGHAQVAPETIPSLGNFSLPTPTPTPTPLATPTAQPTPRPTVIAPPAPLPSATPTPRAPPTPRATETPRPRPSVIPTPRTAAPTPNPAASPTAIAPAPVEALPTPAASAAPPAAAPAAPVGTGDGMAWWLIPAVLLGVIALGGGFVAWRRRRVGESAPRETPAVVPSPPAASPIPSAPASPSPIPEAPPTPRFLEPAPVPYAERAWVDLDTPQIGRAGVNLVTATADVTVVVRNASSAYATGVTLEIRLTSAQPGQDEALAEMFAAPIARVAAPPFDLAAGETKRIRALATLPREAITVLTAADRPMFVPVVAIRADYGAGEGVAGQTTAAYALGIERAGHDKLAPFWLDQPPRMFDAIGVRAHAGVSKT